MVAMALGAIGLGRGIREHVFILPSLVCAVGLVIMGLALTMPHGGPEAVATMLGVSILALGHRLNMMAKHPAF